MGWEDQSFTCTECGGVNSKECEVCFGQGSLPVRGFRRILQKKFDDLEDKVADILDKCNDIMEQLTE